MINIYFYTNVKICINTYVGIMIMTETSVVFSRVVPPRSARRKGRGSFTFRIELRYYWKGKII